MISPIRRKGYEVQNPISYAWHVSALDEQAEYVSRLALCKIHCSRLPEPSQPSIRPPLEGLRERLGVFEEGVEYTTFII